VRCCGPLVILAFARCSQNPRANPKEKPLFALMQSRPDILGLFSINVVSFSIIVVLSALSFSANVVLGWGCFRARAFMFSGRYM
jgi:hypothetical protein